MSKKPKHFTPRRMEFVPVAPSLDSRGRLKMPFFLREVLPVQLELDLDPR